MNHVFKTKGHVRQIFFLFCSFCCCYCCCCFYFPYFSHSLCFSILCGSWVNFFSLFTSFHCFVVIVVVDVITAPITCECFTSRQQLKFPFVHAICCGIRMDIHITEKPTPKIITESKRKKKKTFFLRWFRILLNRPWYILVSYNMLLVNNINEQMENGFTYKLTRIFYTFNTINSNIPYGWCSHDYKRRLNECGQACLFQSIFPSHSVINLNGNLRKCEIDVGLRIKTHFEFLIYIYISKHSHTD